MDNKWPLILRAGVVAGVMDGLGASLMFYWRTGKGPEGVFRYVASGALGNVAFTGSAAMAVVGVIFHLIIALIWALIYVRFSVQIRQAVRSWVVRGVLYAIFVWMIMNLVVIPLSRTPDVPLTWMGAVRGALVLVFCIGLPIAFITHRYYESGKASQ
jgi:hypothetical protein